MVKKVLFPLFILFSFSSAMCQTDESGGWLFLTHTQKISNKFDFLADVQLRSADEYRYWNTVLLRGALNYNINDHHAVAAGYTFFGEWEKTEQEKEFMREHRIFEQYRYQGKLKRTELTLRARLEQRFVKEENINFSQRVRAFASLQIPLIADADFEKGVYLKLQDEIFLNIQNKENVNGSLFDQHRPFAGIGFRTGKKLDVDLGYMRLLQREMEGDVYRNVMQISITTNF